ncbi:MAG: sensor histidine kinase KdpD, partial [Roseiflexaceae bacterium]|nr:sensor histidine kinase KdpD [Roseiflexaceae bacterium]
NVQHIESLNDVVAQITGVIIRETIPDHVLERADEIELIDLAPEELLDRLREGKVYVPDRAAAAVQNFFRKGNLIALRELALRRTAERVDAQMQRYRQDKAISTVWATSERVLVCIGAGPLAARLVRAGRRLTSAAGVPWIVLYVETPAELRRPEPERESVVQALRLAEQLGAETLTLSGNNVAEEVLAVARQRNIGRIIIGSPTSSRWRDLLFGSTVDTLVRKSGEIDLHIVSGDEADVPPPAQNYTPTSNWQGYSIAIVAVALVSALGGVLRFVFPDFAEANIIMAFLLAVIALARWVGRGPSITASFLSVLAFDFFFVPPFLTFAISDAQYLITFVIMLVAAFGVSTLTFRLRQQAEAARQRERRTAALYAMSRELASVRGYESLLRATVRHISETFESQIVVLLPCLNDRRLQAWGSIAGWWIAELDQRMVYAPDDKEQGVAQWVFEHSQAAGRGTTTLPSSQAIYLPLNGARGVVGVLGVRAQTDQRSFSPDQMHLLETFANQTALALERARLAEETEQAAIQIETERMRSSLLSSVSHDLRTPLATITGAASSLLDQNLSPATQRELTRSIFEEGDRLNRLVTNLLEMTRLESGSVRVKKEWQPIDEVIGTALARTERELAQHPVSVVTPPELLLVPLDAVLIEQVLINLLENAARHTPAGSPIEITASTRDAERTQPNVYSYAQIEIADHGPGLTPGEEDKIFEKFYRAGTTHGGQGAGLGLAIAEGITRAHGGQLSAENRPGGGAVFRLLLPIEGQPPNLHAVPAMIAA